ncbi:MAG: acyl-CoA dehydrogenase family protein [Chloroflexi bacterium]|nr:acyl-CoA dehydrogenase family protein [Chloroflexota bacterium]
MDFELPEELKMVQGLARDFVNERLRPLERDLLGRAADLSDARAGLPPEVEADLAARAREVGLWAIGVPEELGGAGLGVLVDCLVEEELARTVAPFDFGNVSPILFECNGPQRQKYLLPVLERRRWACLALLEPGKKDITDMECAAMKVQDHNVIDGRKISLGRGHAGGDWFAVVFARAGEGPTCFLVDGGTPGLSVSGDGEKTGWQAQARSPLLLSFEGCRVEPENVLGEEGRAFHLGQKWLPARRIVRGARCVGMARRLLEEAAAHAQTWQSFGQPLSVRPDIRRALADMAASIHAARLVVYEAACRADAGKPVRRESVTVKLVATQMLDRVADAVSHVFNGPAHRPGLAVERLCRDAAAAGAEESGLKLGQELIVRDLLNGVNI